MTQAIPHGPDVSTAAPADGATRRQVLTRLAGAPLLGLCPDLARAREPVVVLTAYPEEVTSRFEAAFEKAHPEYRVQWVWRMPHDALPYLQLPGQSGVDVYWSASPRTYAALRKAGALRPLDLARDGLPERIGGTRLADPDGYYVATEVAGYGFVWHPQRLMALGLPPPQDWTDLADPGWQGHLALPVPSRVGFAPVMVDIVLQAFGWERGWALWSAIAGHAALVGSGSTFITDEVASGRRALGLTIDFFAAAAIAGGAPLRLSYPRHGGLNPAHIALTADASHLAGARAFAQFVLSDAGQTLLAHPSIRKLPVRPAVYEHLPAEQFNPFVAARQGGYDYNGSAGQDRLGLVAAVFEQMLVAEHADRAALWQRVHAAEAAGRPAGAAARRWLTQVPLTEAQAQEPALLARFRRSEGAQPTAAEPVERAWREQAAQWRQQAAEALA
jgi:phosphoglycerate transport regulatory protein PgtC